MIEVNLPISCYHSSPDHHYHYHYHRTEVFHRMNPDDNDDEQMQSWWKSSQINGKMCKVSSSSFVCVVFLHSFSFCLLLRRRVRRTRRVERTNDIHCFRRWIVFYRHHRSVNKNLKMWIERKMTMTDGIDENTKETEQRKKKWEQHWRKSRLILLFRHTDWV